MGLAGADGGMDSGAGGPTFPVQAAGLRAGQRPACGIEENSVKAVRAPPEIPR
jgi:hypothetical protein